jgi:hypothetical protein
MNENDYEDEKIDKTTLQYALYVRKSTAGDEKQARSIEDQIDDCVKKANDLVSLLGLLKLI